MTIYLIRHGETNGNANRVVQTPDTPLSKKGYKQAQEFANAYCDFPISCIVSSDYTRAQSTAIALHSKLDIPYITNKLLRERNFGDLRGHAYANIPDDIMAHDYYPPNGESYAEFTLRVGKAWQQIMTLAQNEEAGLLVMTHGLVLRCILSDILLLPEHDLVQTDIQNTCVTKVTGPKYTSVELLCDVSHLEEHALKNRE